MISSADAWPTLQVGDLFEILDRKRVPINAKERAARLQNASAIYPYYGATGKVGEIDDYLFDGESILVGEDGAPFLDRNKPTAYLVDGKYWVNNHAHILRAPVGMSNAFFAHQLNQVDYRPFVSGTTRLKLTKGSLKEIPLKVPDPAIQHAVADKIDELFSRIDEGERALKAVETLVERYRQSVLKAAVTGELTRDWRQAHQHEFGRSIETGKQLLARILKARREAWEAAELQKMLAKGQPPKNEAWKRKYKEVPTLDVDQYPDLPNEWTWTNAEAISAQRQHALKAGPFGSAIKKSDYSQIGYKVYGQEQAIAGDASIGNYYIPEAKFQELRNCRVAPGDILISLVGTIGKVLVLPEDCEPGIINPRLVKVSLDVHAFLPEFFKVYFESEYLKSLYQANAHGATMDVLNLRIIKTLPFPLCSLDEQREIVRRVSIQFEQLDRLVALCEHEHVRAKALRQSVLASAFSGELLG